MKKLAVSSGTVLYEKDNQLFVALKPSRWTTRFMVVTGLITAVAFVSGALQILFHPDRGASYTVTAIGVVFGVITFLVYKHRKKVNALPWEEHKVICTINHSTGKILDGDQKEIGSIADAHVTRKFQLTSSAPALVLLIGGRTLKLVTGSPFTGGVSAVHKALLEKGINKK